MHNIEISLNGEKRRVSAGATVAALLAEIGFEPRRIAVERNEAIVPRSLYGTTALCPGDALEIVHFIGGG